MSTATITSKHQVTIPKEVRRQMNVHTGDQIEFEANESGRFVLRKCSRAKLSDGAAAKFMKQKKHLSVEDMKAAAKRGALRSNKNPTRGGVSEGMGHECLGQASD